MAELDLGKQIGPLPLGGWIVVVGGGLAIAYFVNRGQANEPVVQPLVQPGVGTGLVPAGAAFQPIDDNQPTGPANNQAWGVQATNWLIAQGQDPTLADNAVRKYLASEDLTLQENAMIALVLSASGLGSPPEPLAPVDVPQIPETPIGDPKLTVDEPHTQTVSVGSRITVSGRVTIGGKPPGSPQLIRFTSYGVNNIIPIHRWVVMSDENGVFSTRLGGWGAKGTRTYEVAWKDSMVRRFVRVR